MMMLDLLICFFKLIGKIHDPTQNQRLARSRLHTHIRVAQNIKRLADQVKEK